jgi:hypothetical protein
MTLRLYQGTRKVGQPILANPGYAAPSGPLLAGDWLGADIRAAPDKAA